MSHGWMGRRESAQKQLGVDRGDTCAAVRVVRNDLACGGVGFESSYDEKRENVGKKGQYIIFTSKLSSLPKGLERKGGQY